MMNRLPTRPVMILALLLAAAPALGRGELFDNTVRLLSERYYDEQFRIETLPGLIDRYRDEADDARTRSEERLIVHELLSEIPASHLALISLDEYRIMFSELQNKPRPTFGFSLVECDGEYFAHAILDGGPAAKAGVRSGDRIVSVDGVPVADSERLDWRSDDAALPDPPVHRLLGEIGDGIRLEIERRPSERLTIDLAATRYAAFEAMKQGARLIEREGAEIAYIHLWFIHMQGVDRLLARLMRRDFRQAAALVVDLRGRGGSADMAIRIVRLLRDYREKTGKPVIVLIDSMTRSAKEVISHGIRKYGIGTLVGERTAGAVLPATFEKVDDRTVLMFPSFTLARYTKWIEGIGVEPDVEVAAAGPYSAGADPILEAGLDEAARQAQEGAVNRSVVPE